MKKLVFVLVLALLMAACGGNSTKDDNTVKVGVSISSFDDTFLMYMKDGMADYAKALGKEVEVTYVDAKEDAATQLSQVENFVVQGMDAVVVVPVNTEATGPITQSALESKIPLVYVNRKPNNLPKEVYYVGSEDKIAGELQAKYLAEQLDGQGNIVVLMGKLDNEGSHKRTEGVEEILGGFDKMQVTRKQTGQWQRSLGMSVMENWLASGDRIDAVASNNDDMAIGAIEAIEAAGKAGEILIVGVDATPDGLAELQKGRMSATVFQDAAGQGKGAIEVAVSAAKGMEVEKEKWIPFQLVTQENIDAFTK